MKSHEQIRKEASEFFNEYLSVRFGVRRVTVSELIRENENVFSKAEIKLMAENFQTRMMLYEA